MTLRVAAESLAPEKETPATTFLDDAGAFLRTRGLAAYTAGNTISAKSVQTNSRIPIMTTVVYHRGQMKKLGVPIVVGLVVGSIASVAYVRWIRSQSAVPAQQAAAPTPAPVSLLTWTDSNGFTFQYPEGLAVNKHDEDTENYAHLEFTHPQHPGKLIVWGKDPAKGVTDVATWVNNEKRFTGASVLDTEFGEQAGKKVMIRGINRTLVVGTVYDGIVWTVEATLEDAPFWSDVHAVIANSFRFVPVQDSGSTASSEPAPGVDDMIVDEEEIVE